MSGLLALLGLSWPWDGGDTEVKTETEPPPDPRAAQLANELMMVHEAAVTLDVLDGQRDGLLATGEQQINAKEYDDAAVTIGTLRDAVDKENKNLEDKGEYEQQRGGMAADEQAAALIGDLPADLKVLKETALASAATTGDHADNRRYGPALASLTKLKDDIKAALDRRDALAKAKLDYENDRKSMEADEQAVAKLGDLPTDLKGLKDAVGVSRGKTEDFVSKGEYDKALESLTQFKSDLKAALDRGNALATAKVDYEKERKGMELDEKGVMRIADTPGALKDLKDAFVASRGKTEDLVSKGEYDKALASLTQLKVDLNAAVLARRSATDKATQGKVNLIKFELDATTKKNKKPAWEDVGSPEWEKVVDKILDLKVDDEFTDSYDAKNALVADAIAKDPVVQNAYDNWATWTADPQNTAEIDKLMKQVVKLQSDVLGIKPSTPTETFTNTARPGLCGQYSKQDNKISLNTANKGFKDFRELLDTLTHENTHAYQAKLINGLTPPPSPPPIKPGHPEYAAAIIFAVNTNKGYVTSAESDQHPKNAYDDQPKEVHAWRAGRLAGQTAYDAIKKAKGG